jgi:hypothetical protein
MRDKELDDIMVNGNYNQETQIAYLDPISNTLYSASIYNFVAWNFMSFMGTQG